MALAVRVLSGAYHDSVKLMRISAAASEKAHVRGAAALMGTPMNLEQLAASGLLAEEAKGAGPNDLVLVLEAQDAQTAQEELTMMEAALTAPRTETGAGALHGPLRTHARRSTRERPRDQPRPFLDSRPERAP